MSNGSVNNDGHINQDEKLLNQPIKQEPNENPEGAYFSASVNKSFFSLNDVTDSIIQIIGQLQKTQLQRQTYQYKIEIRKLTVFKSTHWQNLLFSFIVLITIISALYTAPIYIPEKYVTTVISSLTFIMGLMVGIILNNSTVFRFMFPKISGTPKKKD
jgi:hypothetical protein